MSPRTARRRAREAAMQALFQIDHNKETTLDDVRVFLHKELDFPELEQFALTLVEGVQAHQGAIDDLIASAAQNWSIKRMNGVDRNVLRIGVYEMKFTKEETPVRVAISEAIEVCRRFSTGESARFVHGVLARITGEAQPTEPPAADEPPEDKPSANGVDPHADDDSPL